MLATAGDRIRRVPAHVRHVSDAVTRCAAPDAAVMLAKKWRFRGAGMRRLKETSEVVSFAAD